MLEWGGGGGGERKKSRPVYLSTQKQKRQNATTDFIKQAQTNWPIEAYCTWVLRKMLFGWSFAWLGESKLLGLVF